MGASRLTQFVVVVEYVISAIKYLNSHNQLPVDLTAQSVRALSRSSDLLQVTDFSLTSANPISLTGRVLGSHFTLAYIEGRTYVCTDGRTEVTS